MQQFYHHEVSPSPSSFMHPTICMAGGISLSLGISNEDDLLRTGKGTLMLISFSETEDWPPPISPTFCPLKELWVSLLSIRVDCIFVSDDTVATNPLALDTSLVKSILRIRNRIWASKRRISEFGIIAK